MGINKERKEKEMRILLASPDRDFLSCYQIILSETFGETKTVFDGTELMTLIAKEQFDIVLLDRNLPRVENNKILLRLNASRIPVLTLTGDELEEDDLTLDNLPCDYLRFPFESSELISLINEVIKISNSDETLDIGNLKIKLSDFCFTGGVRVTVGEIKLIKAINDDKEIESSLDIYIKSLNKKLKSLDSDIKIEYINETGYKPVNKYE